MPGIVVDQHPRIYLLRQEEKRQYSEGTVTNL